MSFLSSVANALHRVQTDFTNRNGIVFGEQPVGPGFFADIQRQWMEGKADGRRCRAKTISHCPQWIVLGASLKTRSYQILQGASVLSPGEGGSLLRVGNVKRSGLQATLVIVRRFLMPAGKVLINESGWLLD